MQSRLWFGLSTLWLVAASMYLVGRIVYDIKVSGGVPVLVGLLAGLTAVAVFEYRLQRRS